ncbi:MAG: mechanosensitive ion channel family protein [Myxococcota bacterium]
MEGWYHYRHLALFAALLLAPLPSHAQSFEDEQAGSPRAATAAFLSAVERNDADAIARSLGVPANASAARKQAAVATGKKLATVLSKSARFDVDDISDDPAGKPGDGAQVERIATLRSNDREVPIILERSKVAPHDWIFSRGTQARVPELYARYGPSPLEVHVPAGLRGQVFSVAYWQWLGLFAAIAVAFIVGRVMGWVLHRIGHRLASRTHMLWDDELVQELRSPTRLFFSVFAFVPFAHLLSLPGTARLICIIVVRTLGVTALAWAAIRVVAVISNVVERRAARDSVDATFSVRTAQTQVRVLRRVVNVVLSLCAVALVLLQFDIIRNVGVSLLASAGIAGVVLGLAAQRTLGSIFAGIQLSITQPIRIGDEVLVEGEFGTIEEITLTYVVVRVWDERRLVVPITRFLEHPFQNWTKVSRRLHGTVMLHADFTLPVDALRAELDRLLQGNARWDLRTKAVHVTDARERTLEIRVLVSAENGSNLFDLRAELREKLIAWLTRFEDGRYLPKTRFAGSETAGPNSEVMRVTGGDVDPAHHAAE